MVKITDDGRNVVTVPKGVFESTYKHRGFRLVKDMKEDVEVQQPEVKNEFLESLGADERKAVEDLAATPKGQWKKEDVLAVLTVLGLIEESKQYNKLDEVKNFLADALKERDVLK